MTEAPSRLGSDESTDLILVDYDGDGLQDVLAGDGGGGGVFLHEHILP